MIGPLVAEIFEFENVYAQTHGRTNARTPDRPVYYKLTFEPSLVAEIFEFENVYAQTHGRTNAQTPDRPVYYKLTFEPSAQVS